MDRSHEGFPRSDLARHWSLDPAVDYLNHGSFGACPTAVLAFQSELRRQLEREPVDFLWRKLPGLLADARAALGGFLGADPDDLAFVPNATAGVNAVVRSLRFEPGDEILTTDHAYGACRKTLEFAASRAGARVVVARVPFPLAGEDDVVSPVLSAVTPRTRLALLDHVTSPTALVFPVERLVLELASLGVDTLVDGAHAPGMVPLDLQRLGAAYYTGNAHKWLCAPKGAAFLHVRRDRRQGIHPVTISHGFLGDDLERFRAEFDWTGTGDPTPFLSVPEAIRFVGSLVPGGWPEVMERNRSLALQARTTLGAVLGVAVGPGGACPEEMVGSMACLPLPAPAAGAPMAGRTHDEVMSACRERGVETWLFPWPCAGGMVVRISAQLYNDEGQYRRLATLLREAICGSSAKSTESTERLERT
ncbi:MAG TPA: aminotransferase class V-fold PLP-dependent enzyme [Thermoanaerobaculia bacterium]